LADPVTNRVIFSAVVKRLIKSAARCRDGRDWLHIGNFESGPDLQSGKLAFCALIVTTRVKNNIKLTCMMLVGFLFVL
jgi:hypothetical protein